MHQSDHRRSRGQREIEAWLVERVAMKARLDGRRVDPRQPFSSFGIDSVTAVSLAGEMEDWIGHELSPTLLYDYPTIDALAQHLATGHLRQR